MGIGATVGTIKQTDTNVVMGVGSTRAEAKEPVKAEPKHEVEITEEVMAENPELAEQGVSVGDKVEVTETVAMEDLSWAELRKLATEKGYEGKKQDKQTLLEFLKQ